MRVAGIDCGTNSVRLLIAEAGPDGRLAELVRELRFVRLGEGVDRTGRLSADALERTRAALVEYAGLIARAPASSERGWSPRAPPATPPTATSSSTWCIRSSTSSRRSSLDSEEAALTFAGAVGGMRHAGQPMLVVDIGGGSTELVLGDAAAPAAPVLAVSLDIGSVRLTERHLHSDPPTPAQIEAARHDIVVALEAARSAIPLESGRRIRRGGRHRHHHGRHRERADPLASRPRSTSR